MISLKKITAVLCVIILEIFAVSCSRVGNGGSEESTTTSSTENVSASGKVELKTYEFPEFLSEIDKPDVLSSVVYSSFNSDEYTVKVEEQPFDGYSCEECIGGVAYTFSENGFIGLLNSDGKVLIKADTYTSISAVSDGLLVLSRNKEQNAPDEYAELLENGKVNILDSFNFNSEDIAVAEHSNNEIGDEKEKKESTVNENYFTIDYYVNDKSDVQSVSTADGIQQWDLAELVDIKDIDTSKYYPVCCKVTSDNTLYYVCFDSYYNYTIYNSDYALVKLKVGDVYGQCYILDNDDYSELSKMISSFGSVGAAKVPTNDQTLDFIQIIMGLNTADQTQITVSSDGYCFTEALTQNEQPMNKYFTCLDKESFVSLVLWVDQVVSAEYS